MVSCGERVWKAYHLARSQLKMETHVCKRRKQHELKQPTACFFGSLRESFQGIPFHQKQRLSQWYLMLKSVCTKAIHGTKIN